MHRFSQAPVWSAPHNKYLHICTNDKWKIISAYTLTNPIQWCMHIGHSLKQTKRLNRRIKFSCLHSFSQNPFLLRCTSSRIEEVSDIPKNYSRQKKERNGMAWYIHRSPARTAFKITGKKETITKTQIRNKSTTLKILREYFSQFHDKAMDDAMQPSFVCEFDLNCKIGICSFALSRRACIHGDSSIREVFFSFSFASSQFYIAT